MILFNRFPVDYAFVGDRDGFAGREPNPALWRREAYRRGYAQGLLCRAERIAQGALRDGAQRSHRHRRWQFPCGISWQELQGRAL